MTGVMCRAVVWILALLLTAGDAAARGGGRGGGRGGLGGGGFSRGGGGFSRSGTASGGSFGQGRETGGRRGGEYAERGPAERGSLRDENVRRATGEEGGRPSEDWQAGHEERQERRQERQEERQEQREDWHDYAHDHYDDYYDDDYYSGAVAGAAQGEVLATPPWWTLDCAAPIDVSGTTYYECESAWYVRVYHDGEVAYAMVNPPPGH